MEESKKLTWFEGVIPQEDSYYLRRDHSFYILVVDDDADQEQVKSLFSSDFFTKVLNAVALTGNRPITESSVMWTKSPCQSVGPKLTNVWTQSSGFRQGLFLLLFRVWLSLYKDLDIKWILSVTIQSLKEIC